MLVSSNVLALLSKSNVLLASSCQGAVKGWSGWANITEFMYVQGMVDDLPDDDDTAWAHQITAGNATELRKLSDLLLVDLGHDFHKEANTA